MHTAPPLRPKKSLGQHFLRDGNITRKIIGAINPQPDDLLLEIGPGEGALTKLLAPVVHKLIVVDIDKRVIERTRDTFQTGVEIIHQDFLTTDLESISTVEKNPLRIVGNIPYNITSPILFHILDNRAYVADAVLMIQKEVAQRLVAVPSTKDYGILSVFFQLFADVTLLFDVSPSAFYPKPKVISSVLQLKFLKKPRYELADELFFRRMVRSVFGKRRKTLQNSLRYFFHDEGITLSTQPFGIDLLLRPEALTVQQLTELSNRIGKNGSET